MQLWQFIEILQHSLATALPFFGVLGLCVGSFLNVLIYRTPKIMMQQWRVGSVQLLQSQSDIAPNLLQPVAKIVMQDTSLSLASPASHCPCCNQTLRWYHNTPVLSWIALGGKCYGCGQKIHWRYPLVEISTALLSMLVIYRLGVTAQGLFALLFVWTLIALTGIDLISQYLPDKLTFPLMALGLSLNSYSVFVTASESIWGLLLGYFSLWIVVKIFYLFTKKQSMGEGDFKLLAALGAWLGPVLLPFIILLSSLLGSIIGIILMRKRAESRPFAFGPYLALAGIVALLYGHSLIQWHLH
ncbi:prepilin peptidase [Psychrobacter piechaudii]|uniref:Prepilin leader peptidase/N-methyltransferase n=1 Tax=Psychrobacter piechaudii TaxID=1945521 RepID=A0A1R4GMC6_9GAMM|nr:A24 family peptidase [Psychrobacter piechaudii]SJM69357.1 Type 4 prepilin-like proteins leader peptide-processing enzyme [Psychrobacter piechaudii]